MKCIKKYMTDKQADKVIELRNNFKSTFIEGYDELIETCEFKNNKVILLMTRINLSGINKKENYIIGKRGGVKGF